MSKIDLSVITCTYNPSEAVFRRVLESLKAQTLPKNQWDYVIVDNGSVSPVARSFDVRWHPSARVVHEPARGLTRARLCGVENSRGQTVVFVDDDNILEPGYLEKAIQFLREYPFIGVLGGVGTGEFERCPDEWIRQFSHVLAVVDQDSVRPSIQYAMAKILGPWLATGAGMAVRRNVLERYRDQVLLSSDRIALDRTDERSLVGGGDTDLSMTCVDIGMASGVSSLLRYTHVIPAWRLEQRYLERLLYSSNYRTARLLIQHGWKKETQPDVPLWKDLWWRLCAKLANSKPERCWRAQHQGYVDGLAGKPYNPRYL